MAASVPLSHCSPDEDIAGQWYGMDMPDDRSQRMLWCFASNKAAWRAKRSKESSACWKISWSKSRQLDSACKVVCPRPWCFKGNISNKCSLDVLNGTVLSHQNVCLGHFLPHPCALRYPATHRQPHHLRRSHVRRRHAGSNRQRCQKHLENKENH